MSDVPADAQELVRLTHARKRRQESFRVVVLVAVAVFALLILLAVAVVVGGMVGKASRFRRDRDLHVDRALSAALARPHQSEANRHLGRGLGGHERGQRGGKEEGP